MVLASDDEGAIMVGTPAWFTWLESATTFAFICPAGKFTARKEARSRGGLYWRAYHTAHGTLHRAYLGKTSDLTLDHLNSVAATLAAASVLKKPSVPATPAPSDPPSAPSPAVSPAILPVAPDSLLSTKLNIPPPRAQLVVRPRLMERLDVGLQNKLTLIAAPAGFGKTTLLSAWRTTEAGKDMPFAWVSLDAGDNDPLLFWRYFFTAVDKVAPGAATSALKLLRSYQPPPIETILTTLINEVITIPGAPGDFVLVLDDYHVIDAKSIDQALTFLLDHMPAQMHLVITTRHDPQLALARLRARDQLTEVRAPDLRFTPSEAAGFLNQIMGLGLLAEDIEALENRTEGWIAGLQLAALALRGRDDPGEFIRTFTGSSRFIIDYLAEEVLEHQPEEVRRFLLQTSVLERMCAPLCDRLLNRNSDDGPTADLPQLSTTQTAAQAMLERLEMSNLFIVPLDAERRWYRYHHLFADLLRQRLHQGAASATGEGEGVSGLHKRASQWYEDNGLEMEAFHHAAAANDVERAERLIEGKGVPLHFRSAGAPVLNWLESLPEAVLNSRPSLWVTYASVLTMTSRHTAVEEKLKAAEAAIESAQRSIEPDEKTRDLIGRIASLRATLAVNAHDVETLVAQSRRALEYLHPDNLPLRTAANFTLGNAYHLQGDRAAASQAYTEVISISKSFGPSIYATAATLCLGQIQEMDNRLHLAEETYRRVILLAGDPPRSIACEAYLGLARLYYQWNDLVVAEQHAQQCVQLTQQMDSIETVAACGVLRARLQLVQGDVAGAAALLGEAEAFVRQHNFMFRMPDVAAAQVLTLIAQGNLLEAAHLAEIHRLPISQARVFLAQNNTAPALLLLEPLRRQAEANGWADERLKVMLLEAIALHINGEDGKAMQTLGEALLLAKPEGFVRVFIDEDIPMADLLSEALARGVMPEYTGRLLTAWRAEKLKRPDRHHGSSLSLAGLASPIAPASSSLSAGHPMDTLSPREVEVLQLMAQGLSNHEIGQRLFLALSTVKGHNRIIFSKLQVQRRTEAVACARELGLL